MRAKITIFILLFGMIQYAPISNSPPLSLTIALICFCGLILLILGVMALGFVVRRRNNKEDS